MCESTIRRWRKLDLDTQRHKASGRSMGGGHPLSYPAALEIDITAWVLQRRDRNLAVSTQSIQLYQGSCTTTQSLLQGLIWLVTEVHEEEQLDTQSKDQPKPEITIKLR